MAQLPGQELLADLERATEMDSLIRETEPRNVRDNGNGSLRSTLPKDYCANIGIGSGSPVQMMIHNGIVPVIVHEECIIIRKHPEASNDE
ncbi:hypothetical protein [Natronorubrum halophilum]|uniref:hypothetical protein n=1 Tax=Natronorubrum halophilum TaxID=1702106 RepID=UPI0013CF3E42|nr:hypothetical protein [Natronorubrum halophilum]